MLVCTGGLSVFHDVSIVVAVVCKFPIRHREIGRIYPQYPPGPTQLCAGVPTAVFPLLAVFAVDDDDDDEHIS